MSRLIDWENVCLVCLQKGENRSIFEQDDDSKAIADKIMKCSNILIKRDTDQPKNICLQCLDDLNVAYKFRRNCEQSDSIIKALLNKNHHELEVSGLRIKIPVGLNVKRLRPSLSIGETQNCIKPENEVRKTECKTYDECDNYDSADFLETTEILDDDACDDVNTSCNDLDDDPETEVEAVVEDHVDVSIQSTVLDALVDEGIEEFALISELNDVKVDQSSKAKLETNVGIPKRRRGRPKNSLNRQTDISCSKPYVECFKTTSQIKPQKICEICGNSYKYQHALNSHMRRHRNERPFNCDFCDKAFVSAVELRRHMRVHTGQKPYECRYCDRRFSDYGSRIKHERTHTGERPYICPTCGKTFAYAHVLTVHLRTHTGEKKYMCKECGRGFTKKAYLENHIAHHLSSDISDNAFEQNQKKIVYPRSHKESLQIEEYAYSTNINIKHEAEHMEEEILPDEQQYIAQVSMT